MSNLPAYILKDCSLFVDAESKIGQTEEIVLPTMEVKTEEFRNGGMVKPREVHMGYAVTQASFKLSAYDPHVLGLFGIAPGAEKPIIAYGYLQDEDGTEHAARCEMRGYIKKADAGTWKTGDKAALDNEFAVNSYRLFIDDTLIAEVDDFDVVINGVSATPNRKDILRFS